MSLAKFLTLGDENTIVEVLTMKEPTVKALGWVPLLWNAWDVEIAEIPACRFSFRGLRVYSPNKRPGGSRFFEEREKWRRLALLAKLPAPLCEPSIPVGELKTARRPP